MKAQFKKLVSIITVLALSLMIAGPAFGADSTSATLDNSPEKSICEGSGGTWSGSSCSNGGPTLMDTIRTITNILLYVLGAVAVIMIIVGGIRYVTSGGDQNSVTGAKNTILYAIIGLVVAALAYAIVNFVLLRIK